jgi:U3 small nucleolar RNA-associated protein 14
LTVAEEKYLKAMSLEEAKLRHKELQRMRALLSYQEAKYKRQSKIKSKKYHRILRKERLRKEVENFDEHVKSDPEAALKKLNDLDLLRALERASLKHKNTGKWAKHNKLRAKYDENARQALSDQIELSKMLLKKQPIVNSDESEDENDETVMDKNVFNNQIENKNDFSYDFSNDINMPEEYNPWLRNSKAIQVIIFY